MTIQYTKKEEIQQIIKKLKQYKKEQFVFTDHYWFRITLRDIDHDFLIKTFFDFDKIKLVEENKLKKGDTGYNLYYELSNNRTLIIGVCPKNKLIFIHGIMRYRKWQNALKSREKS